MSEFLAALIEANIAAAAAVGFVLVARGWVRRHSGAHAAYLLWAIVPVAMLATLIPARTVIVPMPALSPVFDGFEDVGVAATSAPAIDWMQVALSALPWLWIAGLSAMAMWLLLGQARFLGDVKRGRAGPAVVGLIRPHIVIPSDFGGRFEAREQELILAHERFHLARQDARLNTLVALARCVCWFNPMIHVGSHVMRIDQELSCDAAVVGRRPGARRTYAETLLKTQLAARPLPMGCYWPAGTQHPLTERIAMLTRTSPSRRTRLLASAAVVLIAAGAGVASWAAQPERTVLQEAPQRQPAPARAQFVPVPAPAPAPRALPAPTRDYFVPVPQPPEAPAAPAPMRDYFVPIPAPEAPQPTPVRDFFAPVPALEPLAAPQIPEPLAAPEPLAPLEAPQELTPAERDALLRELEAQRKEMEAQRAQMEIQRAELERQRVQMELQRKEFEAQRQQFQGQRDRLELPLDGAVLKDKQRLDDAYKLALQDKQKEGVTRDKLKVLAQTLRIVAVKPAHLEIRNAAGDRYVDRDFTPGASFTPRVGAGWTVSTQDGSAFEYRLGDQSLGLLKAEGGPVYSQSIDLALGKTPGRPQ